MKTSCPSPQAQLLAACESDKVAASRALQQNRSLKDRLEELHGAVVTLTNGKAEVMDRLEDARNQLRAQEGAHSHVQAMKEAVKAGNSFCLTTAPVVFGASGSFFMSSGLVFSFIWYFSFWSSSLYAPVACVTSCCRSLTALSPALSPTALSPAPAPAPL